jgi:hypothetical protein
MYIKLTHKKPSFEIIFVLVSDPTAQLPEADAFSDS